MYINVCSVHILFTVIPFIHTWRALYFNPYLNGKFNFNLITKKTPYILHTYILLFKRIIIVVRSLMVEEIQTLIVYLHFSINIFSIHIVCIINSNSIRTIIFNWGQLFSKSLLLSLYTTLLCVYSSITVVHTRLLCFMFSMSEWVHPFFLVEDEAIPV